MNNDIENLKELIQKMQKELEEHRTSIYKLENEVDILKKTLLPSYFDE